MMIPDAGNRTFTIKLENSLQRPPFKYFTTDVVGWVDPEVPNVTRMMPMVWDQWTMTTMPLPTWIDAVVKRHSDDTDAAWSVTYKSLDTMPWHHQEVQS
jgi:hypothetical protein